MTPKTRPANTGLQSDKIRAISDPARKPLEEAALALEAIESRFVASLATAEELQTALRRHLLGLVESRTDFTHRHGPAWIRLFYHPGGPILMAHNGREGRSIQIDRRPDQIEAVVDFFLAAVTAPAS